MQDIQEKIVPTNRPFSTTVLIKLYKFSGKY